MNKLYHFIKFNYCDNKNEKPGIFPMSKVYFAY